MRDLLEVEYNQKSLLYILKELEASYGNEQEEKWITNSIKILSGSTAERTERCHQPVGCLRGGRGRQSCVIRITPSTASGRLRLSVWE